MLPADEVRRYAARLLSMDEAFLACFDALPGSHSKLVLLLVENPVLSGKGLQLSELDSIMEEKFSSVRSLTDAVEIIAASSCSFDALFLVPHLHLNMRF